VSVFRVDRSTGALLAASPATSPTGSAPSATATAQGRFLYVGCNGKVDAFRVNLNTGALTAIAGSPYAVAGVSGSAVAGSPGRTHLYAGGRAAHPDSLLLSA